MSARVHADRATDAPRDPHVEREPGAPRGGRPPGEDGQGHGGPGPQRVGPGTEVDVVERGVEDEPEAREPGVGDEQVGAPADHQERRQRVAVEGAGHRCELPGRARAREHRHRPAHVVGGEVGDADVTLDAHAGAGESRRECVGIHERGANHSSGAVVRSPAPSVSTTSPGRARRGTWATRSARRGR